MPGVIILAGGLGNRLRSVIGGIPKSMAEINSRPFLEYLLGFLARQSIKEVILSVGYKAEAIKDHFRDQYDGMTIQYAVEDQPLGTGGAIRNALQFVKDNDIFVMNGDTLFPISLATLLKFHKSKVSCITLALKFMKDLERYGKVTIDAEGRITGFVEKQPGDSGLINGGIYIISRGVFDHISVPDRFSFETDFLEKNYRQKPTYGLPFDDYFIDIGVPFDYERAKTELKKFEH